MLAKVTIDTTIATQLAANLIPRSLSTLLRVHPTTSATLSYGLMILTIGYL